LPKNQASLQSSAHAELSAIFSHAELSAMPFFAPDAQPAKKNTQTKQQKINEKILHYKILHLKNLLIYIFHIPIISFS
jgi:hypothetical protein